MEHQEAVTTHSQLKVTSLQTIVLTVSTPLTYFTKNIILEPSVGFGINMLEYSFQYSYDYVDRLTFRYASVVEIVRSGHVDGHMGPKTMTNYVIIASVNILYTVEDTIELQGTLGINNVSFSIRNYF